MQNKIPSCGNSALDSGSYLSTSGTGILPLLQFLMTLFVGLIMAPKAESFSAQGAGYGATPTKIFSVVGGTEVGTLSIGTA